MAPCPSSYMQPPCNIQAAPATILPDTASLQFGIESATYVDELGYLSYCDSAANLLFHVVNERHVKFRSIVFTTNKALVDWGAVLHDRDLAATIIDRVLERGCLVPLEGPSMRTRHLEGLNHES